MRSQSIMSQMTDYFPVTAGGTPSRAPSRQPSMVGLPPSPRISLRRWAERTASTNGLGLRDDAGGINSPLAQGSITPWQDGAGASRRNGSQPSSTAEGHRRPHSQASFDTGPRMPRRRQSTGFDRSEDGHSGFRPEGSPLMMMARGRSRRLAPSRPQSVAEADDTFGPVMPGEGASTDSTSFAGPNGVSPKTVTTEVLPSMASLGLVDAAPAEATPVDKTVDDPVGKATKRTEPPNAAAADEKRAEPQSRPVKKEKSRKHGGLRSLLGKLYAHACARGEVLS